MHVRRGDEKWHKKSFNDEHSRLRMTHSLGMNHCARVGLESRSSFEKRDPQRNAEDWRELSRLHGYCFFPVHKSVRFYLHRSIILNHFVLKKWWDINYGVLKHYVVKLNFDCCFTYDFGVRPHVSSHCFTKLNLELKNHSWFLMKDTPDSRLKYLVERLRRSLEFHWSWKADLVSWNLRLWLRGSLG